MTSKHSYLGQVFSYMRSHKTITRYQAASKLGCYCLPQTILDLRRLGVDIETSPRIYTENGKSYVKYRLLPTNAVDPRK